MRKQIKGHYTIAGDKPSLSYTKIKNLEFCDWGIVDKTTGLIIERDENDYDKVKDKVLDYIFDNQ